MTPQHPPRGRARVPGHSVLRHQLRPLVGILVGIGLLNKHTLIVYALSLALALLLTPARRHVLNRWFWLGALLAALAVLPNVLWQLQHDLASLEFYRNANLLKNIDTSPLEVFLAQVFVMNPLAFPVWFAGLCFFLFSKRGRALRVLGLTYLFLLATMMWAGSSRPDRMLAAYPMLFAGGATLIAGFLERHSRWVLQTVIVGVVLIGGLGFAPPADFHNGLPIALAGRRWPRLLPRSIAPCPSKGAKK